MTEDLAVDQRGFTLTEMLVAVALIATLMTGLMTLLLTGQRSYALGTNQVEAQQNLRIAMSRMLREIREAGYDPRATTAFTPIANQTATALTLQNDWDGDGAIAGVNAVTPPWGGAQGERVVYSLSGSTLRRQETGIDGAALPVAEGVQSLAFQYLDAAGAVTSVAADIRTVVVSITTRPVDQPASGAAGHIQVTMTDRVRLRNRGT